MKTTNNFEFLYKQEESFIGEKNEKNSPISTVEAVNEISSGKTSHVNKQPYITIHQQNAHSNYKMSSYIRLRAITSHCYSTYISPISTTAYYFLINVSAFARVTYCSREKEST